MKFAIRQTKVPPNFCLLQHIKQKNDFNEVAEITVTKWLLIKDWVESVSQHPSLCNQGNRSLFEESIKLFTRILSRALRDFRRGGT